MNIKGCLNTINHGHVGVEESGATAERWRLDGLAGEAGRGGGLRRQDSCHPTIVMVNKCNQEELRRKFRNYEI